MKLIKQGSPEYAIHKPCNQNNRKKGFEAQRGKTYAKQIKIVLRHDHIF